MAARYESRTGHPAYACATAKINYGEPSCQSLSARPLDAFVQGRLMDALAPASLDLSIRATEELECEPEELAKQWKQRLERAAYEADQEGDSPALGARITAEENVVRPGPLTRSAFGGFEGGGDGASALSRSADSELPAGFERTVAARAFLDGAHRTLSVGGHPSIGAATAGPGTRTGRPGPARAGASGSGR